MKDQVDKLNHLNIPAICINSTMSPIELQNSINNIYNKKYKLIYIAPERLNSTFFINCIQKTNISLIAIDEAHCVSQWGHDFRKSYLNISNFISSLNIRPVVSAFTASATITVKQDIISILNLINPFSITTTFNRENLKFFVTKTPDKKKYILDFLLHNSSECGIIYCNSRRMVDFLYDFLSMNGLSTSKYHAGMPPYKRTINQNKFLNNSSKIMIATNAFGMGIDKPNIRFVIHYNMPKSMEDYYQEAGRAGRDGKISHCILLYDKADILANKYIIDSGHKTTISTVDYYRLDKMAKYCTYKGCLRSYILNYFGENYTCTNCYSCGNCLK